MRATHHDGDRDRIIRTTMIRRPQLSQQRLPLPGNYGYYPNYSYRYAYPRTRTVVSQSAIPRLLRRLRLSGYGYGYGYGLSGLWLRGYPPMATEPGAWLCNYGYHGYGYGGYGYGCGNPAAGAVAGGLAGAVIGDAVSQTMGATTTRYGYHTTTVIPLRAPSIGGAIGAIAGGAIASGSCY